MEDRLYINMPPPGYPVGALVIALINHQPRYATIQRAMLSVQIDIDADDVYVNDGVGWEYEVLVHYNEAGTSESIVLAERTIIMQIDEEEA